MDDRRRRLTRLMPIVVAGAIALVALTSVRLVLTVMGVLTMDAGDVVPLVLGLGSAALVLVTARSMRADLADPGGMDGRFPSSAITWASALLIVGFIAVSGVILWGVQPAPHVDFDQVYPEGSCVVLRGIDADGSPSELVGVDCTEPHTHVVRARIAAGASCPPGTDATIDLPGQRFGLWCFGVAAGASETP